jgi:hypothetical protein
MKEDRTMRTIQDLMARLWADDDGSVIASEYLMLGGIVSLGSVAGMTAMRDAANQEMEEFGQTVRVVNRTYRENLQRQMQKQFRGRYTPRPASYGQFPVDHDHHEHDIRFMSP